MDSRYRLGMECLWSDHSHQRQSLHGVLRNPANGSWIDWRRPPGSNWPAQPFDQSCRGHRLFWTGRRQCLLFFDPHQHCRRNRARIRGRLWNPWPQHLPRACFSANFRRVPNEGDALARRNGETAISRGVLQHLQHCQFRIAGEHFDGTRFRNDQSHGRILPGKSSYRSNIVLKCRQALGLLEPFKKRNCPALSRTVAPWLDSPPSLIAECEARLERSQPIAPLCAFVPTTLRQRQTAQETNPSFCKLRRTKRGPW